MSKITQIIDKYISQENYYFINRVYKQAMEKSSKEKKEEILKSSFKSQLIMNKEAVNAHRYSDFWTFLSENFSELSEKEKKIVIELMREVAGYNYQNNNAFVTIVIQYYFLEEHKDSIDDKLATLRPIFSWGIDTDIINKVQNQEFYQLWLLFILSNNPNIYREEIISNFPTICIYGAELESRIITLIESFNCYSPIEDSLEYDKSAKLLFLLLKERKLNLDFMENASFYKCKWVQKIFVYLDNKGVKYPEIIDKIKSEINYQDKIFGSELNLFLKNHPDIIAEHNTLDEYKDGFSSVRKFDVIDKAFINIEGLKKLSVQEIIELLNKNHKNHETFNSNTLYIFGVEGQNKELISFFETDVEKGELLVAELLKNRKLIVSYSPAISVFLQKNLNKREIIIDYINAIEKDNINYETYKIFKALVEVNPELVYEFIITLEYSLFEEQFLKEIQDEKFIDINYFINSNIGKFYEILREYILNTKDKEHIINSYISKTENMYLKQYLCGFFYKYLSKELELKDPTFNSFQGMSHYYRIGKDRLLFYKGTVIDILLEGTKDSFLKHNMLRIMIYEIDPKSDIDVLKINYELLQNLLPELFRAYLQISTFNKNSYNWLLEIFNRTDLSVDLIENMIGICKECNDEELRRIDRIISAIENNDIRSSKNIELYSIEYYIEDLHNDTSNFRAKKFDIFIKILILIFKNKLINLGYTTYTYTKMDDIMLIIDKEEMFHWNETLLSHIREYFPETDYKMLRRKYLKFKN
ncbi:hypothetical protein M3641_00255 [Bacillus cereus]|uniref:hypothetical protein n=1 Tax=Bacillus cereus TaxID=1396 RepID=UPI00203E0D77|nr:hypothetical protein [Bacillus cereus]MCM3325160.1 hypothetical protein [Bacillus cereus]MDA2086244.1 hypothetical protein [Bacillus cereus]